MRRIAIVLSVLALLAAACGDDDGLLGSTATTEATATTLTTDDGGATTTTGDDGTPGTTGSGAENDAIQAALDAYETAAFRAVYRFGSGDDEQIIVLSQDPGQDPPVSATLIGAEGEDGRFITIGDRSLMCGPPGEECLEFEGDTGLNMGQALLGPALVSLLALEDLESTPGFSVDQEGITIGGRTGVCFTFSPTALMAGEADIAFMRQCIDSELGFILLFEGMEAGGEQVETVMELLEFGTPTPADFEPSGPVTTMPSG